MPDTRQKYQLNIALTNGQAFEIVTMMPLQACRDEIKNAHEDMRWAQFDAINPFDDTSVSVDVDPSLISGTIHRIWVRPPVQGVPQPIPRPSLM